LNDILEFREAYSKVVDQLAAPKKRRGRPPKAKFQPEGVDAAPELVTVPSEPENDLEAIIEAPSAKPKPPMPPILAKEVLDSLIDKYQFTPGNWRMVLNTLVYMQRLGRYWSQQTKK
jgi:hypothetical protein